MTWLAFKAVLGRIVRWFMAHPWVGLAGLLFAALWGSRARSAHLEAKAARAQDLADKARRELAQRESDAKAKEIILQQRASEAELVRADERRRKEQKDRRDAEEDMDRIEEKYR